MINKNTLSKIIVFFGNNELSSEQLNDTFINNPKDDLFVDPESGTPVFNDDELDFIKRQNIPIIFVNEKINADDSIVSIKIKLLQVTEKIASRKVAIEELYLFCSKQKKLTPEDFYNSLTQNKRIKLTHERLENALQNFKQSHIFSQIPFEINNPKDSYSYDDLLSFDIFHKDVNTLLMLGQRMFIKTGNYPFSYNPYDLQHYDTILNSGSFNSLSTTNNNLLLENGDILNNNIYVCFAQDVLTNKVGDNLNDDYLLNVYFPLLSKNNIKSLSDLQTQRDVLLKNTETIMNEETKNTFVKENMLHEIHKTNIGNAVFTYANKGVVEIKMFIHQKFSLKIPLDTLFKLILASETMPMIKINPSTKNENNYKLYGSEKSKNNRVIPLLSKQTINSLINTLGKNKGVSVFFNTDKDVYLSCDFQENGDILVYMKSQTPRELQEITDIVLQYINPVIEYIYDFFSQSGYIFEKFTSLYHELIEIVHIEYASEIIVNDELTKVDIEPIKKCVTPIFVVNNTSLSDNTSNIIEMRYRKVSNFNKMTSIEAYTIENLKRKDGLHGLQLIEGLMSNYNIDESTARDSIATVAAQLTLETGNIGSKIARIRNNPGFYTKIIDITKKGLRSENKLQLTISGIDNIYYIEFIEIYVDSLFHLLFNYASVSSTFTNINEICRLVENENIKGEEILSSKDGMFTVNDKLQIVDEEVIEDSEVDAVPVSFTDYVPGDQVQEGTNALALLYGDGNESETYSDFESDVEGNEDEDADDNDDSQQFGGNNPVGMKLKKPSPFMEAMEAAAPELFLKKTFGTYDRYSRLCDGAYGRQPIVLTKDEYKDMISTEKDGIIKRFGQENYDTLTEKEKQEIIHKNTQLDHLYGVTYGVTPEKEYVYVCPRYWCLKTNQFIHPDEMVQKKDENGEPMFDEKGKPILEHPTCGGIIPKNQDKVKDDGNFVYEFSGKGRQGSDGSYAPQHPGFLPSDKHPKGLCIPCCFKLKVSRDGSVSLNSTQKQRRMECVKEPTDNSDQETQGIDNTGVKNDAPIPLSTETAYIMDQKTFPLTSGRWGFLQIEVQHFFKEYTSDYQLVGKNAQLPNNMLALLRHGADKSEKQSFLTAMADVMFYENSSNKMQLEQFKEYIIEKLTIERFAKYQNGNLITTFSNMNTSESQNTDISQYSSSPIYQEDNIETFQMIVNSYESFIQYIKNEDSFIDHTHLWDFMCDKDVHESHPKGINLVILHIPEDDSTTNIELVCPSNHYSASLFNVSKPTVFLIEKENVYEPIYSFKREEDQAKFQKYFLGGTHETPEISPSMTPSSVLTALVKIINPIYQKKCSPLYHLRRNYTFTSAIHLDTLYSTLKSKMMSSEDSVKFVIHKEVVNFSFKTIGLVVSIDDKSGFIPCYPSAALKYGINDYVFMDDESIYNTYDDTIEFINTVIEHFSRTIPIQPAFKLVEDEVVVGFITITDQIILLSEPIDVSMTNDDIPIINHKGYTNKSSGISNGFIDKKIMNSSSIDTEREEYINKIKLETNFFNAFRNTMRILLNDYSNLNMRSEIDKVLKDDRMIYSDKMKIVSEKVNELSKKAVIFSDELDISKLQSVSTCIHQNEEKCITNNPVCIISNGISGKEKCMIVIPKRNIISPEVDNEDNYIRKISDQLIRYVRIRSYMLDKTQFLTFADIKFQLSNNEVVLSQSILKDSYFDNLDSLLIDNTNIVNAYDNVNPIGYNAPQHEIAFNYDNVPRIHDMENPKKIEQTKIPQKLRMTQKLESDTTIVEPIEIKESDMINNETQTQTQTRTPKKLKIVQQLTSSESDNENEEIEEIKKNDR